MASKKQGKSGGSKPPERKSGEFLPPAPLFIPIHQLQVSPLPISAQLDLRRGAEPDGTLTLFIDLKNMNSDQNAALQRLLAAFGDAAVIVGATATPSNS